ncbi:LytTR family DNA-binding domain-containing protein [Flavobacterium coralii]|uniref:LytR/AlgR family response regulator transcription factor n=1 Tax=Flavobacterium coralii TaxID=2838017 RepID=UPI000C40AE21|nr:LytTR family DNA-binding domain-containing protein [Flavobacterium coralii]MBE99572.1 DNA-binding response regulator [Flavobacterium sp.]MBY8961224.1 LytTR family DNA-binding domain-containing protein [Flavobacterium coralii]|tara:strand:- start:19595 stop:20293 length:699 start_codon:yes stop_codon:yes gene_type:complete
MKLNCVVVDDSTIHRITIAKLVNEHPDLNLIGDFSNASETRACILHKDVDLLFLDIEMPVQTGFDLLDGLKTRPQIIFVSAKSDYALKAFDYAAIDYLHKPVTKDRFNKAVQKAIELHQMRKEVPEEEGEFIFVKSNLKNLKIYIARIKWVEAFGDYIKIITDEGSHLVLSTMKSFEAELPSDKFLRVHKSYIINIERVQRFNSKFAEIGTTQIPLSRNKKEDLAKAINNLQ